MTLLIEHPNTDSPQSHQQRNETMASHIEAPETEAIVSFYTTGAGASVLQTLLKGKHAPRWMWIAGLETDGRVVMLCVADPKGTSVGHDAVIAMYVLFEDATEWWNSAGLNCLSVFHEKPYKRPAVLASGTASEYADIVWLGWLLKHGDTLVQLVIEVKPTKWAELVKGVRIQLPNTRRAGRSGCCWGY